MLAMSYFSVVALLQNFALLGQGSAFMHGSETSLGGMCDVKLNDLFTYVAYQAMVENLAPLDDPLIHELSLTPRSVGRHFLPFGLPNNE